VINLEKKRVLIARGIISHPKKKRFKKARPAGTKMRFIKLSRNFTTVSLSNELFKPPRIKKQK
jgi:hypothetical protein